MNHEGAAVSRATSVSRTKKEDSTLSRNRSLINKNVAPQDLRPSDILIERFVAWKAIVKQLITYFEGLADIQNDTAKELTKLGAVLQVPFRAGNQFLGEGGLQDIFYDIRDKTRVVADEHANFGRTIDGSIVQHLQKLRTEIKAHLKNVQNDTGKLATNVAKERELSTRLISELSSDISALKTTPMNITSKTDPYVANAAVVRQLQKQVQEENLLQKSIIAMQKNSAQFEEGIVRAIQSAWHTYDEWQARMGTAVAGTHAELNTHMRSLAPDREWLAFSKRSTHLLDPETPLRNTTTFEYPSKDDPSIVPVHTGVLERKKRYTRVYRESFFVLTPAGFLHEYAASSPTAPGGREPLLSLFLPMCTLGAPSGADSKSHKFHIEARKDGSGTGKGGTVRRRSLSIHRDHTWSFRARSREDMMGWWNDIRVLCARYLVPSEQMERSGPVAAAVRAAGYTSGEDGTDGTDEGSSVDEDELEYVDAEESHPPSYSHQHEMGASAYPLEKGHSRAPSTSTDAGASVSRRPSKRQQEKAPEVHPHFADDAGAEEKVLPGGVAESKFTEHI